MQQQEPNDTEGRGGSPPIPFRLRSLITIPRQINLITVKETPSPTRQKIHPREHRAICQGCSWDVFSRQIRQFRGFPHSSKVGSSRYPQMRELRTQSAGRPLRALYAFNPLRSAILLIGGEKTGDDRWYEKFVPLADRLFEEHLVELKKEGRI